MPTYLENLLATNEKILLISRQHWFTLISRIALEIVLILVIIALVSIGVAFVPLIAIGYVLVLFPSVTMLRDILDWWNREYVVTNRRVMQIAGIINKNVTDSSLEKVNDIHMEQSVLGRLFNYGNVEILTASELGVNLFKRISEPIRFKTALLNAKEELERGRDYNSNPKQDLPSMIASLEQLRQQGVLTEEEFQSKKAELLKKK